MPNEPTIVFETPRLQVRLAEPGDVELYFALLTDPRVMTNVGFPQGLRTTREEIRAQIIERGADLFKQRLLVELKSTGSPIGEAALHLPDDEGVARTDVKLLPAYWGNRYGVEVKRGLIEYLFTHTDAASVEGAPNVHNAASIKMQEAVGGVRMGERTYEFPESMRSYTQTVHALVYRVDRAAWERTRAPEPQ